MRYRAKPLEIDAVRLGVGVVLTVQGQRHGGKPGDFLVTYPNGGQAILTAGQLAAGFEPVNGDEPIARVTATAKTIVARHDTSHGRRRKTRGPDEATLIKMRQQWQAGVKVAHIAKACGVGVSVVYYNSFKGKWQRGKPTKGGIGLTVGKAKAPSAALPGRVRCPHCQEWTETDPCSQCKKRMAKW